MRKLIIAALLTALAIPAIAADTNLPTETVTVSSNSLTGVWKITMPEGFKSAVLGKTEWGSAIDAFCRVEDIRAALTIHCPGLRTSDKFIDRGSVSIDKGTIRLIWGSAFKRLGIAGTLRSVSNFDGTFFVERFGISSDAPLNQWARNCRCPKVRPTRQEGRPCSHGCSNNWFKEDRQSL